MDQPEISVPEVDPPDITAPTTSFIIAEYSKPPGERMKAGQIAKHLGISPQYCYTRINQLRAQGRIQTTPRPKPAKKAPVAPENLSKLLEIASHSNLTPDEQRKIASYVAQNGKDSDKLTAIKLLKDLSPPEKDQFGPPPPTNDTEQAMAVALQLHSLPQNLRDLVATQVSQLDSEATAHAKMGEVPNTTEDLGPTDR